MMRTGRMIGALAVVVGATLPAGSAAAVTAADKCEAAKLKVAGTYYFCREKAEAMAVRTASTPDYSKCAAKFMRKWDLAATNGGVLCPDSVLTAPMNAYIADQAADAAAIIAGTQGIPACGDNVINVAGEQCDGADLGGETCASLVFSGGTLACASCAFDTSGCTGACTGGSLAETGQTTCYDSAGLAIPCGGTGQDGELQKGLGRSFTDNGTTIMDNVTGLEWEKLTDDGDALHDRDIGYTWPDGFAKVAALNSANFAGHNDWRLPNRTELLSISNIGAVSPATFSPFDTGCTPSCTVGVGACSCTNPGYYWSSSTYQFARALAWSVLFVDGDTYATGKTTNFFYVRAVRGGS